MSYLELAVFGDEARDRIVSRWADKSQLPFVLVRRYGETIVNIWLLSSIENPLGRPFFDSIQCGIVIASTAATVDKYKEILRALRVPRRHLIAVNLTVNRDPFWHEQVNIRYASEVENYVSNLCKNMK